MGVGFTQKEDNVYFHDVIMVCNGPSIPPSKIGENVLMCAMNVTVI